MTRLSIEETVQFLNNNDGYLILTHTRPDGDTIGCAAALCVALRQIGKTAFLFPNPEITPQYEVYTAGLTADGNFIADTIVAVDTASEGMLAKGAEKYAKDIALCIDHHPSNTEYADRLLLDASCGACGEIIYEILLQLSGALTGDLAERVYVAVSTDTGCFSYTNTTANSLRVASECAKEGFDLAAVNKKLFRTKTRARVAVETKLYSSMKFLAGGKAAVCVLTLADIDNAGATEDDLENITALPAAISGVTAAVTLREMSDGQGVKGSVRSYGDFDSNVFAQKFGGGGHKGAAGFTIKSDISALRSEIEDALETEFRQ